MREEEESVASGKGGMAIFKEGGGEVRGLPGTWEPVYERLMCTVQSVQHRIVSRIWVPWEYQTRMAGASNGV